MAGAITVRQGGPDARILALARETRAVLNRWARIENGRAGLWAPVALGAGAAVYFTLRAEPPFWIAPVLLAAFLPIRAGVEKARLAASAGALLAAGFLAADLRTAAVDAPMLRREVRFAEVEGRLRSIDEAPKLRRLIIDVRSIEGVGKDATPARIRVSWRGKAFDARPGDLVSLTASLSPPPAPAAPGSFDYARQLYFQRIGAVGFAVSSPTVIAETRRSVLTRARAVVETVRVDLTRRIIAAAPGDRGAIVAAVVTGKREAISEEAEKAFRDSGLTHLLSISGLHMGLATGLIFFAVRALLALIEPIALTQPIKKWAAIAALVSGFLYLQISGGAWPAERAFIMSMIVFIAILADRRALSLRNVAVAAFIIILTSPEAVLHAGFQMSFAAATALVAWYEWSSARADPTRSFTSGARLRRYVVGIGVTDVVASGATAPYALYHFNRTANFGLIANMVSIPIMGFWVMPAALVALLLMPFGADAPAWRAAAAGVDIMLRLGAATANLPGAVAVIAQWPLSAILVLTLGGLWLCLMAAAWRLIGLVAIPAAAALIAAHARPDLYISEENAALRFERADGSHALALFDPRKAKFETRVWLEEAGIDIEKSSAATLSDVTRCDRAGCVVDLAGASVALLRDRAGLDDDCARADLVVAFYPAYGRDAQGCAAPLIDRRSVWRNGAYAVYQEKGCLRIISVAEVRGDRPWAGQTDAPGHRIKSRAAIPCANSNAVRSP